MQKEQLRKAQLYILNEIKRICEKHKIDYFLDSGTMLGAIRHKGYIPWDDDIDIGMTLDNYYTFLEHAKSEIGKDFFVDNYEQNEECPYVFTKIRLKGTKYIELKGNASAKHNEIFVDVFPYYYVSNNKILRKIEAWMTLLGHAIMSKSGCKVWAGDRPSVRWKFLVTDIMGALLSKKTMFQRINKMLLKHQNTDTMCVHGGGAFYTYWYMPADLFSHYMNVSFEGEQYPVPKNYDLYLSIAYGNYLKIPEESERITHKILELDMGKYGL